MGGVFADPDDALPLVVVTSFDLALRDEDLLTQPHWAYVIVSAHALSFSVSARKINVLEQTFYTGPTSSYAIFSSPFSPFCSSLLSVSASSPVDARRNITFCVLSRGGCYIVEADAICPFSFCVGLFVE